MYMIFAILIYLPSFHSLVFPSLKVKTQQGNEISDRRAFIKLGEAIHISCTTMRRDINITSISFIPFGKKEEIILEDALLRISEEVRVDYNSVAIDNSGTYTCKVNGRASKIDLYVFKFDLNLESSIELKERDQTVNNFSFIELNIDPSENKAVLSCKAQTDPTARNKLSFKWYGPGLIYDAKRFHIETNSFENGSIVSNLILNTPTTERSLYGDYRCTFEILDQQVDGKNVSLSIPPVIVKSSTRSETRFTNENFTFKCDIFYIGERPEYSLSWKVNGRALDVDKDGYSTANNRTRLVKDENNDYSIIEITNLTMAERSVYSCHLDLSGLNKSDVKAIFLRVKDENRKIWPMIGIGIELGLLFVIIVAAEIKSCRDKRASRLHQD